MERVALRKVQAYFAAALWISWATILWAGIAQLLVRSNLRLPYFLQLGALLSGALSFVGGCVGVLYLLFFARRRLPLMLGAAAVAANFWYFWWFLNGIMVNPP